MTARPTPPNLATLPRMETATGPLEQLALDLSDEVLLIRLRGDWLLKGVAPPLTEVERVLSGPRPVRITFDASQLGAWDSRLLTFVSWVARSARRGGIQVDLSGLPAGARKLVELSEAVPEKEDARRAEDEHSLLWKVGVTTLRTGGAFRDILAFLGGVVVALGRALRGKARMRGQDLLAVTQQVGLEAVGIVALVNFLLGLILAFVGAVQLDLFGASIYVADLVGIAMVRDMSALMTAVVMAGRSGAAFAAELGSMRSNQEIDALVTTGISPMEFLVLPRVLALILMMPLLTIYGDFVGILGGATVAMTMLAQSPLTYLQQTVDAVTMSHVLGGLFKGAVYGGLVGLAGCLRGLQAGRSSLGVGRAATSAVVTGIILVISACGFFAWAFYLLGI